MKKWQVDFLKKILYNCSDKEVESMEKKKQKCSLEEHNELDATNFCPKCEIYICNKCEKYHSSLFRNHQLFSLDKDINEIFTGFCKIENHNNELPSFYDILFL